MNWKDFERATDSLLDGNIRPILRSYENKIFYLGDQKVIEMENTYENFFENNKFENSDFVWLYGGKVRIHFITPSYGHPELAGFDIVVCAGVVKDGSFFFHSGRYRPRKENIIHFFCDFVEKSCKNVSYLDRDKKIDKLCNIPLVIYKENSQGETYETTFERISNGSIGGLLKLKPERNHSYRQSHLCYR